MPPVSNIKLNSVEGLVEKGPFISGSSVSIYELDSNLSGTGRVFEAKTDNEGAFSIIASTSLVSQYVKLSVNGFYFNEFTGQLSDAPIILESLADISETDNAKINVNILTHLVMPRVLKLVAEGISFSQAKQQAHKELLSAFLINDETLNPEKISITDNNTAANILIAISSVLLNGRSDAQFSEFTNEIRNDLVDGTISDEIKAKITQSSLGLSYSQIKKHIKTRYSELGKTVEIGAFELFIDGDGDGQIGDPYEEDSVIVLEHFFEREENVQRFLAQALATMYSFAQNLYLFDAVYTNSIDGEDIYPFNLHDVYFHNHTPNTNIINELWRKAYRTVHDLNQTIFQLEKSEKDWAEKYVTYARAYRAYIYLNMIDLWGDIPLITSPLLEDNPIISRTSKNEVLEFVISELEHVYAVLPDDASQVGCSKYFAQAVQTRAYLYKKDFNNAFNKAVNIINSGKYTLSSNFDAIYAGNSTETLFELPNDEQPSNLPYRKLIQKGNYMPVCRYAEILLSAAEASYQTGNTERALIYLNQIGARQGVEYTTSVTEETVLNAWKNELQNEGLWFFTLKRFGKATQTLNILEYQLLLPIPEREVTVNPDITQNPGYPVW
jgi:hypothetical protein